MESMKIIIDAAVEIMVTKINIFGIDVTLMALLCLTGAMYLVLSFVFGLFK